MWGIANTHGSHLRCRDRHHHEIPDVFIRSTRPGSETSVRKLIVIPRLLSENRVVIFSTRHQAAFHLDAFSAGNDHQIGSGSFRARVQRGRQIGVLGHGSLDGSSTLTGVRRGAQGALLQEKESPPVTAEWFWGPEPDITHASTFTLGDQSSGLRELKPEKGAQVVT